MLVPGIYGGGSMGNQIKPGGSTFAEKLSEEGMPEESGLGNMRIKLLTGVINPVMQAPFILVP